MRIFRATARARPGSCRLHTFTVDADASTETTDTINTGTVGWSFTLSDSDPVLQSLAVGQVLTQIYTVTVADNTGATSTQDVTIHDSPGRTTGRRSSLGRLTRRAASSRIFFDEFVDERDDHVPGR